MKIQYDCTKFKAALKRNAGKNCDCFVRLDAYGFIRTIYLQTKKALIYCNLSCIAERVHVYKLAIDLGYNPYKLEFFETGYHD